MPRGEAMSWTDLEDELLSYGQEWAVEHQFEKALWLIESTISIIDFKACNGSIHLFKGKHILKDILILQLEPC